MTTEERFWSKVVKSDGCWEWTGCRNYRPATHYRPRSWSYGTFYFEGRQQPAHRVAWKLAVGEIPAGMWMLHHCDNQGCVRPDHLYVGTHADNTRDAVIRRRMARGERSWNHKLTDEDIGHIRWLLSRGIPTETIGALVGVSGRTIRYIRSGEHWSNAA